VTLPRAAQHVFTEVCDAADRVREGGFVPGGNPRGDEHAVIQPSRPRQGAPFAWPAQAVDFAVAEHADVLLTPSHQQRTYMIALAWLVAEPTV
jgi:hypothetical protein